LRDWDELLALATERVAKQMDVEGRAGVQVRETKHMQPFTRAAVGSLLAEGPYRSGADYQVDAQEQRLPIPNWKPVPGGLDLGIRRPEDRFPTCAAELKLRDTHWMLWDLLKMVDALHLAEVDCAYLMVGATKEAWTPPKRNRCLEPFIAPGLDAASLDLFGGNRLAWFDLLTGGSGRPSSIPERLSTRLIASVDFVLDGREGELRCVAVELVPDGRIPFQRTWYCGDWPTGVSAPDDYLAWKKRHWQLLHRLNVRGGSLSRDEVRNLSRNLGFNFDKECGLHYGGDPMVLRKGNGILISDAGRAFIAEWEHLLCPEAVAELPRPTAAPL
jgi:hypothetical protein